MIHRAMQREGHVDREEHRVPGTTPRQEITGADRQWAERYEAGDVVRYSRGSKALGIEAGDYGRVVHVGRSQGQVRESLGADDLRHRDRDVMPQRQAYNRGRYLGHGECVSAAIVLVLFC